MSRVYIGTSGWHYASWRGRFFPRELMAKHQLQYYATQFNSTELNGVFYRTPTLKAVRSWRDQTSDEFVFAWKASKFITHWKRLGRTSRKSITLLETRLRALGDKAGPVLFQRPPPRRGMSMCAGSGRAGVIADIIRTRRCSFGPGISENGNGSGATSMSISTTIRKALPRKTPRA